VVLDVLLADPVSTEERKQPVELVEAGGVVQPDFGVESEEGEVFDW